MPTNDRLVRLLEQLAPLALDNGYISLARFNDPPLWQAELEIDGGSGAILDFVSGQGPTPDAALRALREKLTEKGIIYAADQ